MRIVGKRNLQLAEEDLSLSRRAVVPHCTHVIICTKSSGVDIVGARISATELHLAVFTNGFRGCSQS
jgi:hypothetical protein